MKLEKNRLDYKWVILIVCFLMEFFCLGFCSSNDGLYTKAVTEALDIKRSVYSLATSFRNITRTVVALYFGTLVGKFGAKKLAVIGMLCLAASTAIRGMATNVVHIYIGAVVWAPALCFPAAPWQAPSCAGGFTKMWADTPVS